MALIFYSGKGIIDIHRTSGNGAAGTADTYTIFYTDESVSAYSVYNGKDGQSVHIGQNGNFWVGDTDLGVSPTGKPDMTAYSTKVEADLLYKPISWTPDLSNYATKTQNDSYYMPKNTSLFSGNYSDLAGKPTLYTDAMADLRVVAGITGKQNVLNGLGLVRMNGTTLSYDNNSYMTAITKAQVEAVLTGAITTHTHSYLSAITSSQVIGALGSQTANMVLASPNGAAGSASFRYLQAADIPSGVGAYIWNQTGQQSATINISGSVTASRLNLSNIIDMANNYQIQWNSGAQMIYGSGSVLNFVGAASFNSSITCGGEIYSKPYLPLALSGSASPYYGTNITLASDTGSTQGAVRIWGRYHGGFGGGAGQTHLSFEVATNTQSYNSDPRQLTYTELMRLTSGGNLVLGFTSDQGYKLQINGTGYFNGLLLASQLQSLVAYGTSPLLVNSSTMVNNLNSQYLNGHSYTDFFTASSHFSDNINTNYNPTGSDYYIPSTIGIPSNYGVLLNIKNLGQNWNNQLAFSTDGDIFFRQAINKSDYTGTPFVKLWHSGNLTPSNYQLASNAINSSNIGSQSVNYATSAGNADTLDGYHASSFLGLGSTWDTGHSVVQNGYQKFSTGIIIQWGRANGNTNVTFPIVFPNSVLSIQGSNITSNNTEAFSFTSLTTVGFYFNNYGKSNQGMWFAIGY